MAQPVIPLSTSGFVSSPKGHPRGLYTLFFTEMWERFSYYGMRALLVLFMVESLKHGGMGMTDQVAAAIYGLYTAAVYLAALPGGWVGDRFLGAQRAVWCGGIVIAIGHFTLAIPRSETFYLGLILVAMGTGLLKPNISVIVGELYPEGGVRRDAGFTIFYMGINLGAALGPLVCSYLGEKLNWHYGFAAAGAGMVLGLIQFRLTACHLGEAGRRQGRETAAGFRDWLLLGVLLGITVLVVGLAMGGVVRLNPVALAHGTTGVIVAVAVLYFAAAFMFFRLEAVEKRRVAVIGILFLASALFWSGFEQAGSSLNLFAQRHTARVWFGLEAPAGWFQTLSPVFIITLAPLMAGLWLSLARQKLAPSLPVKFAAGLILLGGGFLVMSWACQCAANHGKVWPTWLVTTYLLHTFAELCVSPVGLSSVTKLAPRRLVGQMMGIWFLATSLGNLIAGLIAGEFQANALDQMSSRYLQIVMMTVAAGLLMLSLARPIKALMKDVE